MRNLCPVLLSAILLVAFALSRPARADNTLRGKLKAVADSVAPPGKKVVTPVVEFDTITAPSDSLVRLSGYDKPLRSSVETLLVTNGFDRTLLQLTVSVTYFDLAGRELHERVVELHPVIPPGATRSVKFKSWDAQKSYYYYLGQRPKVDAVTPYKVHCTVNSCVLNP